MVAVRTKTPSSEYLPVYLVAIAGINSVFLMNYLFRPACVKKNSKEGLG